MTKLHLAHKSVQFTSRFTIRSVSATKFVRKMRGQSQAALFQCSDDHFYVVKMAGNPQGDLVLANEYVSSCVIAAASLPTPDIALVTVSSSLINATRDLWFQSRDGFNAPPAGLHFGSKLVGELYGDGRASDYISRAKIEQITNRDDFLGILLVDLWANNQDHRQALFVSEFPSRKITATFIDNGHMFGGPNHSYKFERGEALFLYPEIYSGIFRSSRVKAWLFQLRKKVPAALQFALQTVPSEWYGTDREASYVHLLDRLGQLPDLVKPYEKRFEVLSRSRGASNELVSSIGPLSF